MWIWCQVEKTADALNRPESQLTDPPGHLWRGKWTALSGRLSQVPVASNEEVTHESFMEKLSSAICGIGFGNLP